MRQIQHYMVVFVVLYETYIQVVRHFLKTADMQAKYLILLLFSFLISCSKTESKKENETAKIEQEFIPKFGEIFYDYDAVLHYKNKLDSIDNIEANKTNSKLGKLKYDIILRDKPQKIYDTDFFKDLEKIGFVKNEVKKNKFLELNRIFVEKTVNQRLDYACIAI
ncbi:hypothetical protein QGN23_14340 [Chryseobacterium gotjawalense]|uniref:Lipoprotein n=1 Tax=Chryseobacterium gotjawalense TaxID=3042315 RepID=A0ABY8RCA0_9FLAO|nr:hypothetical protein [Chryseobacterium sp. wdc7]WHF51583.1 hypothetical protein QGN23_14340 [Chryseobacterium sp. wdc7]